MGQAQSKLKNTGKVLAGIGVAMAAAIVVPLVKIGAESVKLARDFESQMAVLSIAAKSSGETFDTLHDAAIAVGGDISLLGVSATGAGDAMTGLYKAGLTTTEIFGDLQGYMAGTADLGGALRASIDLAAASELDMVAASDLAAVALATFGGEMETEEERAEFINKALNNMVQAADASVAEVSDLAEAIKMVGPSASQLGIGIEDTNNALALLSTAGIAGTRAGSNLDAMLRSLSDPTDKAQDSLDALGVTLFDAEGNFKSMPNIIAEMERALTGMTDEQKSAALGAIFTAQGQRAMNVLLAQGAEGWDEMAAATASAAGIQEQAAARANTLAGAQEALDGALETLKITAGEALLGPLTGLTRWATEMADTHGPMVVAIVEGIVDVFSRLASGDINLADIIPPAVLEVWAAFQSILNKFSAWWTVFGPGITEKATEMFALLQEAGQELADKVLPWIVEKLDQFGLWFMTNAPLINDFALVVMEAFTRIWQEILAAWDVIEPLLDGLMVGVLALATFIMAVVTGDWTTAWQAAQDIVWAAVEAVQGFFTELADWVTGWFGSDWASVQAQWATNWELFSEIVSVAWDNITSAVETAVGKVKGWIDSVVSKFSSVSIPSWMQGHSPPPLANWITDITGSLVDLAHAPMPSFSAGIKLSPSIGPLGAMSAMAGGAGGGGGVTVNIYGPLTVRDDSDVDRIANTISRRVGMRAGRRPMQKVGT